MQPGAKHHLRKKKCNANHYKSLCVLYTHIKGLRNKYKSLNMKNI